MAVGFQRIDDSQVDETRVTLRLMRAAGIVVGRVSTLAIGDKGIELMSTAGEDPPVDVALRLALDLAQFKELDVDVVDPDDLWDRAWGVLGRT